MLTDGKGKWKSTRKTPYESIARGPLIEEAKVWFYFVSLVLLPSKHLSIVRKEEVILLYALLKGYKINVGKIIENSILSYYRSKYRGLIPHLETITKLCILGGEKGTWEEEETCSRASPLTLTGITKGPKKKGKEKEVETEEEEGEERGNEQINLKSPVQKRQRSLSPFLNLSHMS